MSYVIVSDSSSNVYRVSGANYVTVPLKIRVGDNEYSDHEELKKIL